MIVVDLLSNEGVIVGAAYVDETFWASNFPMLTSIAAQSALTTMLGYADTDHPSMNVFDEAGWRNFVALSSAVDAGPTSSFADRATRAPVASPPAPSPISPIVVGALVVAGFGLVMIVIGSRS